jgi:type II secretory pathway component GspD/PulD (secretin)
MGKKSGLSVASLLSMPSINDSRVGRFVSKTTLIFAYVLFLGLASGVLFAAPDEESAADQPPPPVSAQTPTPVQSEIPTPAAVSTGVMSSTFQPAQVIGTQPQGTPAPENQSFTTPPAANPSGETSSQITAPVETPSGATSTSSGDGKISLVFNEAPIERVVAELSRKSGKNVVARGKTVGQKVTIIARDMPLERVLDILVNQKPNWLWYPAEGRPDTYEIWDQESFRAEVLPKQVRQKVFVPREITAEEANKAIQGVLTPNIGTASFDPRSNKLIVTDLPYVLELVQRLIEQIDVKFVTRVFYIAHADVNSIAEKLSNLKSPAAPAPEVDERTHQIIVRDRLDIIRQMELLVETLDIGPEMRVYELNNIGFEGQDRQDLEDAISEVLTPNAYYKINVQSGKLIVEDVPEVHEKIEKILQAFDQPAKQVLIQAEIIETAFRQGFSYGSDWTVSGDLFSSVIDGLTGRSISSGSTSESSGSSGSSTSTGNTQGGSVPVGSQTLDKNTLGFLDFRKEFPIVSAGEGGLNAQYLSRHAYIALKAALSDSRTRILQQPRAIVKNQKEVAFSVGEKVPFFTGGVYNENVRNDTNTFTATDLPQQNLLNVGLDLNIRPTIYNNGLVEMEVEISNDSAVVTQRIFNDKKFDAVGTKNQQIQSTLIIPSGDTRVIGGLVRQDRNESRSGVPGLVKIPVLGPLLFGKYDSPAEQNGRQMLLIFLTPTIISDKPTDTLKYKGRTVTSEDEVAQNEEPEVSPTQSDSWLVPLKPAGLPQPVARRTNLGEPAVESSQAPGTKAEEPEKKTEEQSSPQAQAESEQSGTFEDIKRIQIKEKVTTGAQPLVPRLGGPSGAMTTPTSGAPQQQTAGPSPQGAGKPGQPVQMQRPTPPSRPGGFPAAGTSAAPTGRQYLGQPPWRQRPGGQQPPPSESRY